MGARAILLAAVMGAASVFACAAVAGASPTSPYRDYGYGGQASQCAVPLSQRKAGWTCYDNGRQPTITKVVKTHLAVRPHGLAAEYGTATSGAAQCNVPVAKRAGYWACISPERGPATATPAARSTYCWKTGICWYVENDFKADFHTERVLYGDGNKDIGVVHLTIYWNLTGAQTLALPVQARNSHSTVHTIFRGALYNGAHHAKDGGKLILSCSPNVRGAAAAEKLVSYPKGCKLYDKGKNYDHNMVVETAWELPQYSGYWYCYFRSPVAHAENKETYRFGKASDLPQDFQKVGHDA